MTTMSLILHGFGIHLVIFAIGLVQVAAQNGPTNWTASPFNAPALPLTVRSPYLNVWLLQGNDPLSLNTAWPSIWDTASILGWYSSVVVDGTAYKLLAQVNAPVIEIANQTAIEFSATRTSFIFTAGLMQFNMSFISPIEPTDLVRQSLPFSYVTMTATSTDGNAHDVRMFIDVNGEILTGDTSLIAQWSNDVDGDYIVLTMQLQQQSGFTEDANHALDAVQYFALKKINGLTASWAITKNTVNHALAANMSETLGNQSDTNFRAVDDDWPTLGIAVDWGNISETPEPAVWALGLVRSPSIQYRTSGGSIEDRYPYFLSEYSNGTAAAKAFLDDYSRAQTAASTFDSQLATAGQQTSSEYADLLSLSVRQLMGSIDITVSRSGSGSWNMSDVKVFMKNMGGLGSDSSLSTLSVNTVDVLYAAFPAFMYLNPELAGYLLSPLLEYQDSAQYVLSYAARNIGLAYPNATADGINDSHDYGVEESANMLIMTLAYSQRSGNGTFISRHYSLLRQWAEYLENDTLSPLNQKSPDFRSGSDVSTNNQTNIAIKGIIGIACMAKIAEIAGVKDDLEKFNNTATSYISQWVSNSVPSDNSHVDFFYDQSSTNGLIYNLYADKLLQLNLVPTSVYDAVTSFYDTESSQSSYGIPLDSDESDRTMAHWMMFAASTVTSSSTQNSLISQLHNYAASSRNSAPFPAEYNPTNGDASGGSAVGYNSPAVGAMFSLLALNTTIQSEINLPSGGSTIPSSSSSNSSLKTGDIVGAVVGSVVGVAVILFGLFLCIRRRRKLREEYEAQTVATPIMPTELNTQIRFDSLGSYQSVPASATESIEGRMEKNKLLLGSKTLLSNATDTDVTSPIDAATGSSPRTQNRRTADQEQTLTTVLRGALDDRVYLTREITSIRHELEMLRQNASLVSEEPPSYVGPPPSERL